MPWTETLLPPLAGTIRAVSVGWSDFVAWTEHGLFRYEIDTTTLARMLHPPGKVPEKFDPATGQVRWLTNRYDLVGDPAFVPHSRVERCGEADGWRVEADAKLQQVRVSGTLGPTLVVDGVPVGGSWYVADLVGWRPILFVAHPGGVRHFTFHAPPKRKPSKWEESGSATDHAAILAAVLAEPDDDTPRLVYADWLEENGEPERAELIRAQCRLAERERDGYVGGDDPDADRAWALMRAHESAWRPAFPVVRGVNLWDYWRGFPVVRVDSPVTLVRAAKRLSPRMPIENVRIDAPTAESVRTLLASPLFPRLRVMRLSVYGDGRPAVRVLAGDPRAGTLRGLTLGYANDDDIRALAGSPHFTGLEWLVLEDGTRPDDALLALAASKGFPALQWLALRGGDPPGPAALSALRDRFPKVLV